MATKLHRGLTQKDIDEIEDASVRNAVKNALADRRISAAELDKIIQAATSDLETNKKNGVTRRLAYPEIKALYLIADKSSSLDAASRTKLQNFLKRVAASDIMYQQNETDGWALPGVNFAGPGYRGTFMMRPRDMFDLASKLHDLAFQLNALQVYFKPKKGSKLREPKAQSRKAKADYVFREMNKHAGVSGFYWWSSRQIFDGENRKEFLAGDGYLNPLVLPHVWTKLCNPAVTLMIPFDHLPKDQRPSGSRKYYTKVAYDTNPGFARFFRKHFGAIWGKLSVDGNTGSIKK